MPKKIVLEQNTLKKLLAGANMLADTVKLTLGPRGRNVIVSRRDEQTGAELPPLITNDGVTIAKAVSLSDPFENMGVELVREAASKTNDASGDGTTTATVLTQALLQEGYRNTTAGANPLQLRQGMNAAAERAAEELDRLAVPVRTREDICRVAAISSGEETLGQLIGEALEKVGHQGVVAVDENLRPETVLKVSEGMTFNRGVSTPNFWKAGETEITLQNPYILVTDQKVSLIQDLVPILEDVINEPQPRPLIIIAEEVTGEALATLIMNRKQGVVEVLCINPPEFGEGRKDMLEDIAILTGGVFLSEIFGYDLRETTLDMLGCADSVKITGRDTIIVGGHADPAVLKSKADSLKRLIETTDYEFKNRRYRERLARLSSGIAVLKVGGATEAEMKERKLRAEDAVNAARAAMIGGVVPGGGTAYLRAIPAVKEFASTLSEDLRTGAAVLLKALEAPARQIAQNAGAEPGEVASMVKEMEDDWGFNAAALRYENLMAAGIVDPAAVAKSALQNAVSAAATLLTAAAGMAEGTLKE